MRRALFAVASLVLLPVVVLALEYTDRSTQYTDAPFSRPEAAAISVLTNVQAVQGNPDGSFQPGRTLNRAEFLKIVLKSMPKITVLDSDASACFPDVHASDWFSPYVCLAKTRGMISGYPDGTFRPAQTVNYAEALKILCEGYGISAANVTGGVWYQRYVVAARDAQLLLPVSLSYDWELTRGQMARLAASFRANAEGELAQYRAVEQGQSVSSVSSAASASSLSSSAQSFSSAPASSSASSHSSQAPSSASSAAALDLPARSHFLILGTRTDPIASATFTASLEDMFLRSAQLKLKAKVDSIDALFLTAPDGHDIVRLSLDNTDTSDRTWKGTVVDTGALVLQKDHDQTLAVIARLKSRDGGGHSDQLLQVDSIILSTEGLWSHNQYTSPSQTFAFPQHQTAQARVTSVSNALQATGTLPLGSDQTLAEFSFQGSAVTGATLKMENLEFTLSKATSIAVSTWQIGTTDGLTRSSCSVNGSTLSCSALPDELGIVGATPRVLRLSGDVALDQGAQNAFLQVQLSSPGAIGQSGAIWWSDGSGHFTWTEMSAPIVSGTSWKQ